MIYCEGKKFFEVANEVLTELISQGAQCTSDDGCCVYENDEGHHCAVGFLLPEDRSDLMSEMNSVRALINIHKDLGINDEFIRLHRHRLGDLQALHDHDQDLGVNTVVLVKAGVDTKLITEWLHVSTCKQQNN